MRQVLCELLGLAGITLFIVGIFVLVSGVTFNRFADMLRSLFGLG